MLERLFTYPSTDPDPEIQLQLESLWRGIQATVLRGFDLRFFEVRLPGKLPVALQVVRVKEGAVHEVVRGSLQEVLPRSEYRLLGRFITDQLNNFDPGASHRLSLAGVALRILRAERS